MKKNIFAKVSIVLLAVVLFSVGIISVTLAKYISEGSSSPDNGTIASFGTVTVLEHEAELENGEYKLTSKTTDKKNTYDKVIPGVDILKDPFVTVSGSFEVSFALYVKVVESNNFPAAITYKLTSEWGESYVEALSSPSNGVYVYKYYKVYNFQEEGKGIALDTPIQILKDNKLIVSEKYKGEKFSLTFSAWIEQIND